MPLIIGNQTFNEHSTVEKVKAAAQNLPLPETIPFDQNIHINPHEVVIYMQREMAFVRNKLIRFLGTSHNLLTCLLVHIRNKKGEYAGMHIDATTGTASAIHQLIEYFTDKDELEITIMGGLPGAKSETILKNIITALLARKEKITWVKKKTIEQNVILEKDKLLLIRDEMLEKAKILFEILYPGVDFDLKQYETYTARLFTQENKEVTKDEVKKSSLLVMMHAVFIMTELLPEDFYKIIHNPGNLSELKKKIPEPKDFHQLLKLAFCKNIYSWLDKQLTERNFFANRSTLPNFVFNLETGAVHEISIHMPFPYSVERTIAFHHAPEKPVQHNYFLCYDRDNYVKPVFSNSLVEFANELSRNYLDRPFIPRDEFDKLIARHDHVLFSALREWNKKRKASQPTLPNIATSSSSSSAASLPMQTQPSTTDIRKTIEFEKLTKEAKAKHKDLILYACNGELDKLKAQFSNAQTPQLDEDIKDTIIQCVLEWSKQPINIQNSIITYLISKGAQYKQYFLHAEADLSTMERLISCGADVNINHQRYTALHSLSCRDNTDVMIELLIEKGIDINLCEELYGHGTVLHIYLANESFTKAINFIELASKYKRKINYSSQDKEGKTPLIIATKVMSLIVVKKILAEDKICVDIPDNQGRTALHYACALGQNGIVKALIAAGADINARDNQGNTPAHYVTGNTAMVKIILASIHIDSDRDCGALKNAIFDKNDKAIPMELTFLQMNNLKTTPFTSDTTDKKTHGEILATSENKNYLIKALKFSQGEDKECLIKQINSLTGKSIMQACLEGQSLVMETLVANGADVTLVNKKGQMPSSTQPPVNQLLLTTSKKIIEARPKALDKDGEPTAHINFYDPEFAKIALGIKK